MYDKIFFRDLIHLFSICVQPQAMDCNYYNQLSSITPKLNSPCNFKFAVLQNQIAPKTV